MNLVDHILKKKILIIGDVMLDTYYIGDVKRISPEAPVPVFRKQNERSVLGGAANVAVNLVAAEQYVSVMSIIGNDVIGTKLKVLLEKNGVNTDLLMSIDRKTTEKTRFLASNNQQVLRLDVEDTEPIDDNTCNLFLARIEEKLDNFDLIIISDYMKGLLTYDFLQGVIRLANEREIPVIIDVKDTNVSKYVGAYLLKPNLKELQELTGLTIGGDEEIIYASEQLRQKCNCEYVLTTCGARGMVLVGGDEPYFVESVGQEVFDVTGAGDTTIAYLAACMVNDFAMKAAVDVANYAAGIQVGKVGTSAVYWEEVRAHLSKKEEGVSQKLLSVNDVAKFRIANLDKKIVFTNGCFDILHSGHVRYLREAAKLGDVLVVGINSDESVKRLKGSDRPINCEQERAELMCALGFVDYVVIFEDDTPLELIKMIKPNVLVKGGDYSNEYVVGTNEVRANGGELVLIPFVEGKSTTNIIKKIKK